MNLFQEGALYSKKQCSREQQLPSVVTTNLGWEQLLLSGIKTEIFEAFLSQSLKFLGNLTTVSIHPILYLQ
jgi:hypothetical protein